MAKRKQPKRSDRASETSPCTRIPRVAQYLWREINPRDLFALNAVPPLQQGYKDPRARTDVAQSPRPPWGRATESAGCGGAQESGNRAHPFTRSAKTAALSRGRGGAALTKPEWSPEWCTDLPLDGLLGRRRSGRGQSWPLWSPRHLSWPRGRRWPEMLWPRPRRPTSTAGTRCAPPRPTNRAPEEKGGGGRG